jgi:Kef-type K+ transport system membrane component KefB
MFAESLPFLQMFAGLLALLAAARACGWLGTRLGLPSLFGELVSGVLLGPTFVGQIWPEFLVFLRGGTEPVFASRLIQLTLLIFLFAAGAEIAIENVARHLRVSFLVCFGGWILPFVLGVFLIQSAPHWSNLELAGPAIAGDLWRLSLFFATALSISAVPVIAKILMDLGLYKSRLGLMTMTAAVATDVLAWIVFVFVGGGLGHGAFSLIAFVLGVGLSFSRGLSETSLHRLAEFSRAWLAPLFFASVGLKVNFLANLNFAVIAVVFLLACSGKILGCGVAARLAGLEPREAWAIGFAMNARGAMEIILGLAAFEASLISPVFFVALVVMALVTSLMSGPAVRRLVLAPERKVLL